MPLTETQDIVCIKQYRHGSRDITLEIPGGLIDPGESPQQAAKRECMEETGYAAGNLASLGVFNPNPALFRNRTYSFIATHARPVADIVETVTEKTEVQLVPFARLREYLHAGVFDHALVALSLWRLIATRQHVLPRI